MERASWTATRLQWRLGGRTDRQTHAHRHTDAERHNTFSVRLSAGEGITRGRVRAGPASWAPYAAENQRVGKTRRRSMYSVDRQTRDTTYQPASQPK